MFVILHFVPVDPNEISTLRMTIFPRRTVILVFEWQHPRSILHREEEQSDFSLYDNVRGLLHEWHWDPNTLRKKGNSPRSSRPAST